MVFGKHVNRYYWRFGYLLLVGLAALMAVDYLQLLIPEFYRMVINGMNLGTVVLDGAEVPFTMDILLDEICLPMITVIICMVLGRFLWRVAFFGAAIRVEEDLRQRMFDRARHLSCEYYQVNKVGDLMSLFTNDLETVHDCFSWGLLQVFDAGFLGGLALFKMFRLNVGMTLLTLIPMGLLFCCATVVGRAMERKWDKRQACFSKLSDFSQESFSGIAVIKAFVKETRELMAFKALNEENEEANIDFTRTSVFMRIMVTLFVQSVTCVILGYGGWLVYRGSFNAGQLMEFIGYFTAIIWPIMAISELIDMTARGKASMDRIARLLEAEITVQDRPGVQALENPKGGIEFRDLSFRYPGGEFDALSHVSFQIMPGEHIGLVGRTGAGKTTLVDLILRTYNVPDGSLFLDGRDVNSLSISSVRAACAYVPQDNFLFSDTIRSNIAFGQSEEDTVITEAAKLSDVHDNIMGFADGYETILGERGVTVSGGQKQRLSIARALIRNAPILILDDSVSAVDTATEKTILENLKATRRGKTTILIAHRISTVRQMDRVLFLEEGRAAAFGTHEELLECCPSYRKMVALQQLEEEGGVHHA